MQDDGTEEVGTATDTSDTSGAGRVFEVMVRDPGGKKEAVAGATGLALRRKGPKEVWKVEDVEIPEGEQTQEGEENGGGAGLAAEAGESKVGAEGQEQLKAAMEHFNSGKIGVGELVKQVMGITGADRKTVEAQLRESLEERWGPLVDVGEIEDIGQWLEQAAEQLAEKLRKGELDSSVLEKLGIKGEVEKLLEER